MANQKRNQDRLIKLRQQAGIHYQSGKLLETLTVLRQMLRLSAVDPELLGFAALVSFRLGKTEQAIKFLKFQRRELDKTSARAESYLGLAHLWSELIDFSQAESALKHAAKKWPDHVLTRLQLTEVLLELSSYQEAFEHACYACELDAANASGWSLRASAAHKLQRFTDVAESAAQAISLGDHDDMLYHIRGAALIAADRADEAVEVCDAWLQHMPGSVEGLALKGHALQEAGRDADAKVLFDFDRFVQQYDVQTPEGYTDTEAFNAALEKEVLENPSLKTPSVDDLKYHHAALKISDDLLQGEMGAVAVLEQQIHSAVDVYLATLRKQDDKHPFVVSCPDNYTIYAWGAVLNREGNQQQHIHKDGYLSGCYYVRVPEEIAAESNSQEGDIAGGFEVGRPPSEYVCKREPMVRQFKPYEGLMMLFPAYLYHRTIPFQASSQRISIAFDVMPA